MSEKGESSGSASNSNLSVTGTNRIPKHPPVNTKEMREMLNGMVDAIEGQFAAVTESLQHITDELAALKQLVESNKSGSTIIIGGGPHRRGGFGGGPNGSFIKRGGHGGPMGPSTSRVVSRMPRFN